MSVDISVSITEDVVDIIATPTVNIVNVTNSASIDPGLYDLSEFTNTSVNPYTKVGDFKTLEGMSLIGAGDIDLTKYSVGLGNVDNTSDLNKPISTATQTALNAKVDTNATITGATKTKITYDSKGLVTSGADATTADIADSTNKRYVTDANLTVINNTSGTNTGDQTLSGLGGVPTTRTLTINGTTQDLSADRTFTISTGITIGTTAITSGTVGRVLFEGTGNVVSESANLFWDNTNGRLGIGTSSPSFGLDVNSTARVLNTFQVGGGSTAGRIELSRANVSPSGYIYMSGNNMIIESASQGLHFFASGAERMRLVQTTGNLLVGTTTDAGYKLDVNGTARVSSNINTSGQYTNINTNNFTTAPIALRTIGTDISGISIYKASFAETNSIQFLSNNVNNRFSIGQGYIGLSSSIDFNIARFASSAWTNSFTIFNATGNVAINTTTDVASSKLTIESTTQGFLPPRGTNTQMLAISTPAAGLMFIDNTTSTNNILNIYNGTGWGSVLTSNPTVTAAAALARGFNYTPALTAAANNDVLVGLDINPTFTNGAFTGVTNYALRLSNGGFLVGADFTQSTSSFKISATDATLALRNTASGGYAGINMYDNANTLTGTFQIGGTAVGSPFQNNMFIGARQTSGRLIFVRGASATQSMTLFSTGNFLIQDGGTHTDAGYKLDVNGTSVFRGTLGLIASTAIQLAVTTNGNTRILSTNNDIILNAGSSTIEHSFGTYSVRKRMLTIYGDSNANAGVAIGVDAVNVASAILSADSTTKGFLPPRGTNAQMLAIASPATGLIFFDTTNNKLNCYDGTNWQPCW